MYRLCLMKRFWDVHTDWFIRKWQSDAEAPFARWSVEESDVLPLV